jgi:hypothetical protein
LWKLKQAAADVAFQHGTRGEQPDHFARHGLQHHAVTDPAHITANIAPDTAACDDLIGPTGKEILDHIAAACEEAVSMASLRYPLSRYVRDRKHITL